MSKSDRDKKFKELIKSLHGFGRISFRDRLILRKAFDAGCDAAEELAGIVTKNVKC